MRLFVAAQVPERQKRSLQATLENWRSSLPGARWTSRESWHVTLKFLGEVPEAQLDEVQEVLMDAVARVDRFSTQLTAAGAFPNLRRPRVLWMGLSDEGHSFRNLAGRMDRKFEKAGFVSENRPFRPHVTLARFRDPGGGAIRNSPDTPANQLLDLIQELEGPNIDRSPFPVDDLILFRSHLSPKGSIYEQMMRLPLHPPPVPPMPAGRL